jgi:hypothetical protein
MKLNRITIALTALLAVGATSVRAQEPIRIGYAADMSGA